MPWSGSSPNKSFSRTTGTYTGATAWAQEDAAGTRVVASKFDTHDQDLATGINTCLAKDGGNSPTADINWGGYKITNLADPTDAQHGATKAYVDVHVPPDADYGDITISSGTWTIDNNAVTTAKIADSNVTLAKLANIADNRFLGNDTGGAAAPEEITPTEATAMLDAMVGDSGSGGTKGLVPAPSANDAAAGKLKLLSAGATWYRPSWHFIEELTGTSTELVTSASLAGYDLIRITASVNPDADDSFRMRIGTAGPTWLTGVCDEYFVWNSHNISTGAVNSGGESSINGDYIDFREASFPIDSSTNTGWVGEILIRNFAFARPKIIHADFNFLGTGNQLLASYSFHGHIKSTSVATVIGFSFFGGASFDSSSGILIEGRKFG